MFTKVMATVGFTAVVLGAFATGVVATAWVYGKDPARGHKWVDEMSEALNQ